MAKIKFFLLTAFLILTPFAQADIARPPEERRAEWREKLNVGLDKVEKQISELEAKSKTLSAEAKQELAGTLKDLKKSRDVLREELKTAEQKTKDTAFDYYDRLKSALGELEKGVSAAKKKFTKE